MTHYYFDNCAYYTPMRSDPPMGRVAFRKIQDISTGAEAPHSYLGRWVPDAFIDAATEEIKATPSFDPTAYRSANPDVAASGIDPWLHYSLYGKAEGRPLR